MIEKTLNVKIQLMQFCIYKKRLGDQTKKLLITPLIIKIKI
jgi:hypothetical protein